MNPFSRINSFISAQYTEILNLFLTVSAIGVLVCAFMIWQGSEENVPRFKKGLFWTLVALVIAVMAKGIITWVKAGVA